MELHCGHCGHPLEHGWEQTYRSDEPPVCPVCHRIPVSALSLAAYCGFVASTLVLCSVCGRGRLVGHEFCHGCGDVGEPAPARHWGLRLGLSLVAATVLEGVPHDVAWWLAGRFLGESPGDWEDADREMAEQLFRSWLERLARGPELTADGPFAVH